MLICCRVCAKPMHKQKHLTFFYKHQLQFHKLHKTCGGKCCEKIYTFISANVNLNCEKSLPLWPCSDSPSGPHSSQRRRWRRWWPPPRLAQRLHQKLLWGPLCCEQQLGLLRQELLRLAHISSDRREGNRIKGRSVQDKTDPSRRLVIVIVIVIRVKLTLTRLQTTINVKLRF